MARMADSCTDNGQQFANILDSELLVIQYLYLQHWSLILHFASALAKYQIRSDQTARYRVIISGSVWVISRRCGDPEHVLAAPSLPRSSPPSPRCRRLPRALCLVQSPTQSIPCLSTATRCPTAHSSPDNRTLSHGRRRRRSALYRACISSWRFICKVLTTVQACFCMAADWGPIVLISQTTCPSSRWTDGGTSAQTRGRADAGVVPRDHISLVVGTTRAGAGAGTVV